MESEREEMREGTTDREWRKEAAAVGLGNPSVHLYTQMLVGWILGSATLTA